MAMVDRRGLLVRFTTAPGNVYEGSELPTLLEDIEPNELIADKAYDSRSIRDLLEGKSIIATIPPTRNWNRPPYYNKESYRSRHLVENLFADLKQFRGIATRYCKLDCRFKALLKLAAWVIKSRPTRRKGSPHSVGVEELALAHREAEGKARQWFEDAVAEAALDDLFGSLQAYLDGG